MPKCQNITQRINIMCTKVQEFFEKHNNLINRNNPKVQLSPIPCRPFHKKGACFFRKGCVLFRERTYAFLNRVWRLVKLYREQ